MSFNRETTLGGQRGGVLTGDQVRGVFGQVMGLVALTVGCTALGAYLARNRPAAPRSCCSSALSRAYSVCSGPRAAAASSFRSCCCSGSGCSSGWRSARCSRTTPRTTRRCCGRRPEPRRRSSRATRLARLRDPPRLVARGARTLFWALLALIMFGLVLIFVSSRAATSSTRCSASSSSAASRSSTSTASAGRTMDSAVLIAASIFLDIFNMFLLFLRLFGGGRS